MSRPAWVRLDNASNIFLAARTDIDPKVFRLAVELDHEVDPAVLQRALDSTYDRFPLYHSVLRNGVFWHYLQDSDLRPVALPERRHTCAPIYVSDRPGLLFRVVYFRRRISLEVFHALSDGTGALWFLTDLVDTYARLLEQPTVCEPPDETGTHELTPDSFAHYFRRRGKRRSARTVTSFNDEADPPSLAESTRLRAEASDRPGHPGASEQRAQPRSRRRLTSRISDPVRGAHRVRGTRTPDGRPRLVELTMPVPQVLALARREGVSLTTYLLAVFFESVRRASGGLGTRRTIAASIPVNLRQFFPSTSARNFFTTVRVQHTYGEGPDAGADDLSAVCRQLEAQFRPKTAPEFLERKLRRLIRFERSPALRIVPRPLKDILLSWINHANNRGLTVAISNLGRVTLPAAAEARVRRLLFHVSAVRPQFCAISHGDQLTVSFTSPFIETDHVREFARLLTEHGVEVTVAATQVTEVEIAEAIAAADQHASARPETADETTHHTTTETDQ